MNKVLKFAGIAAIPVYVIFTFISHLQSPAMGPFKNWLSDYGSAALNPSGAMLYIIGCVLAALLLALFYIGMMRWHRGAERKYVVCYIAAEIGGLVAACALILAAILPAGSGTLAPTLRLITTAGMDIFIVFTAVAAFMNPYVSNFAGMFGIITAAFNIVTANLFKNLYIGEWVFFALFMIYVAIVTYNYDRFDGENMKTAHAANADRAR